LVEFFIKAKTSSAQRSVEHVGRGAEQQQQSRFGLEGQRKQW